MIELKQGDCLQLIQQISDNSIDLILTDPPYGINFQSQWKKDKTQWMPKIKNDKKPFTDFIPHLSRIIKSTGAILIFTRWDIQQQFIDKMKDEKLPVRNVLIWDKKIHGMGDLKRAYGSRYQSIIFSSQKDFRFNGKRPQDIISVQRVNPNKLTHPNEKPVELMQILIQQCSKQGDTVLDLFMGSGSVGVAAVNKNRNFIGFELDENYFQIAKQRISAIVDN